jgi:hypothetical protein
VKIEAAMSDVVDGTVFDTTIFGVTIFDATVFDVPPSMSPL